MTSSAEILDSRVAEMETRLSSEIRQFETRLMQRLADMERRLIYWTIGTGIAVIAGASTAVRLFA